MSDKITVHILLHGFPLCGFSNKIPLEWPAGHVWLDESHIEDVNCQQCKDVLEEKKGDKK